MLYLKQNLVKNNVLTHIFKVYLHKRGVILKKDISKYIFNISQISLHFFDNVLLILKGYVKSYVQ